MQRTAEVELTFLERIGDQWRFGVKPHPRFDQLLLDISRIPGLFQFKQIYYTPGSGHVSRGKAYQISEDGMWFFSHLFSNWEEMRARYEHIKHESEERKKQENTFRFSFYGFDPGPESNPNMTADDIQELLRRFRANYSYAQAWGQQTSSANHFGTGFIYESRPTLPREAREAFSLLGIDPPATAEEVNRAYKAKALVTHPDRGGDHAEMVALNKAREVALKYASEG